MMTPGSSSETSSSNGKTTNVREWLNLNDRPKGPRFLRAHDYSDENLHFDVLGVSWFRFGQTTHPVLRLLDPEDQIRNPALVLGKPQMRELEKMGVSDLTRIKSIVIQSVERPGFRNRPTRSWTFKDVVKRRSLDDPAKPAMSSYPPGTPDVVPEYEGSGVRQSHSVNVAGGAVGFRAKGTKLMMTKAVTRGGSIGL